MPVTNVNIVVLTGQDLLDLEKRFQKKIDKVNGCWLWLATINNSGYGQFSVDGKLYLAHRVSYELYKGPIPGELVVDHLCSVRHCVNPDHLEAISHLENVRRGNGDYLKYKTHCKKGHEFSTENTYICKNGKRHCRTCSRERMAERRKKELVNACD